MIMNKKDLLPILLIVISIIGFFLATETVTSGYQFVDDHEILRIKQDLSVQSFLEVSFKWIERDLSIRQ